MSSYGSMPVSPGDPNQPVYGQFAGQFAGQPYAAPPYASWLARVGGTLVDAALQLAILVVPVGLGVALTASSSSAVKAVGAVLIITGYAASIAFVIWNSVFRQGRTGQSIGKRTVGIALFKELDGQPVGPGLAFGRLFVHILDGICYVGYLWPLWDPKKQTFTDKVMTTIVVKV